jgi:hypothetical protein
LLRGRHGGDGLRGKRGGAKVARVGSDEVGCEDAAAEVSGSGAAAVDGEQKRRSGGAKRRNVESESESEDEE